MPNPTTDLPEKQSRCKLFLLWSLAIVLALVSFGVFIYQRALSDVERYWTTMLGDDTPPATLKEISFSSETWITLEFTISDREGSNSSNGRPDDWWLKFVRPQNLIWSLRDFEIKEQDTLGVIF